MRRRSGGHSRPAVVRFAFTGTIAGVVSAVAFAGLHALLISDIWWSVVPMAVAGAVCGTCVAWSFVVISRTHTLTRWAQYNATYVGLLMLLGVVSLLMFDPVTTIPTLMGPSGLEQAEGLMADAMPVTVLFGVGATGVVTLVFGHLWWHVAPVMATMIVITALLGLNVSILGLVEIPRSSLYLVAELFGLIFGIVSVYAALSAVLEWKSLRPVESNSPPVMVGVKEES